MTRDAFSDLATTFDGERLKTYFDGVLSGSVFKPDPVYVENGDLGIGGCPDGSNLFKGWIDDVRIYKTTLSQNMKIFRTQLKPVKALWNI